MRIKMSILIFCILLVSSCYLDSNINDDNGDMFITTISQGVVGDSGDGYYLRAKLFENSTIQPLVDDGSIYWDDVQYFEISYQISEIPQPISTTVFYLGPNYPSPGSIILVGLPPNKEYRVLMEEVYYNSSVQPDAIDYAFLTQKFNVSTGENTSVSGDFLYFFGY